jgi:DNA gyrase/topoisomerase IV subunit A
LILNTYKIEFGTSGCLKLQVVDFEWRQVRVMQEEDEKRIQILEAIVWAQEHHNQVMYLSDESENSSDYRNQLMEKYGFDYHQAQAIIEMRNSAFTIQERDKVKAELQKLLSKR